jgi:peptide deformylase
MKLTEECLTKKTEKFDFSNPPFDPIEFAKELTKFMYDSGGIGLAANQVGVSYSVFAMRGHPENFVCFNPRIVDTSKEEILLDEGCLSYPFLFVKIKRPKKIKVRFNTPNGDTMTKVFDGITARIFQHELDHLHGISFYSRANKFHRDQAFRQERKLRALDSARKSLQGK